MIDIPHGTLAAPRRARWPRYALGALLLLALVGTPAGAAATPSPAAPPPIGPADLLAQARLADLVLGAIADATAGRDLPSELSPQVREDIRRRLAANGTAGGPARLTAFAPLLPIHWERVPPAGQQAPTPTADTATLQARLLGTVAVARDASPGVPARTASRPLARRALTIDLARRDGRWVVTRIQTNTASGSLAE